MRANNANDAAVRDYLDALLQESVPPALGAPQDASGATWHLCKLGRLQLLLPTDAMDAPLDVHTVATMPDIWHLAHVRIGAERRRVAELASCIAPGAAAAAVDTLLPIVGSPWLLAVPGRPVPIQLSDVAIEWRAQRRSRPWLAGMSRESHHMVLDVHALIAGVADSAAIAQEKSPP